MNILVLMALAATLFTWFMTSLGAGAVFVFKHPDCNALNCMLGFASGVMIAASFWSLLEPAIEQADIMCNLPSAIVVTFGFLFGNAFMFATDKIVCLCNKKINSSDENNNINRIIMLVLSITLHNIPEGLAVGVAFGALADADITQVGIMGAASVTFGIALQNFPEGMAVSVPLRAEGCSRFKSFMIGQLSAVVEPIAGVIGAILVVYIKKIMPYALSFAAGTMIFVAVHQLIPECQENRQKHPYFSTSGIIIGFSVMMLLDVMLG